MQKLILPVTGEEVLIADEIYDRMPKYVLEDAFDRIQARYTNLRVENDHLRKEVLDRKEEVTGLRDADKRTSDAEDRNLRQVALDMAVRAQVASPLDQAKRYYEFLKGQNNGSEA